MKFSPDYHHVLDVLNNKKPKRLPLYEHLINPPIMEKILNKPFADLIEGDKNDVDEFFKNYCKFFKQMTYDTVSFEYCIISILPDSGAISGGKPGPIQNRDDFNKYPWDELPARFWEKADPQFQTLIQNLPTGMQAIGGVGNGVFEISEDLVGYEYLSYMQIDNHELYTSLHEKIGDLMHTIWDRFLKVYADYFVGCRFGDDLGFKTNLLLSPDSIKRHILPQYKRIIDAVHNANKKFLLHSCGCIFDIMEDVIKIGIDAKHSNEDVIAPFDKWIDLYGNRIGLFGGIDLDILCQEKPDVIFEKVVELGKRFRNKTNGYALGSGNSIPDYVPVEGYLAMIEAAQQIRSDER
jgi:uroporphyrinogen decarboxylase